MAHKGLPFPGRGPHIRATYSQGAIRASRSGRKVSGPLCCVGGTHPELYFGEFWLTEIVGEEGLLFSTARVATETARMAA